ncbi:unnamed protein product [Linum trigynum]|uniref:Uncharacterized protein n=1 Tax=Linum trigynum TaxID=586398 RepID=A0AAV2GB14_9ROSI
MDPQIQAIPHIDFSFPNETKETLRSIKKHIELVEKACAQCSQDNLDYTIQSANEEEEANHEDVEEHIEVGTESSRDNNDQECPLMAYHTFPHFCSKMSGSSDEMQDDLIKEIVGDLLSNPCWKKKSEKGRGKKLWRIRKKAMMRRFLIFSKGRDHIQKKEGGLKMQLASRRRIKLRWKRLHRP